MNKQEIFTNDFGNRYPNISDWLEDGTIEIGRGEYGNDSFVKVIDEGGVVWEGKDRYATLDEAFNDTENALTIWYHENT